MPSRYTDPRSTRTAAELAGTLGLAFDVRPLIPLHEAAETALVDLLDWPPLLALQTATSNAGEVLAWSGDMNPYKAGKIGMIAPGYYADLILVGGNPLEDIHMIDRPNVHWVMKDGKVYKDQL